ncbi:putative peptidase M54, archaemetzincin, metallopeptidase, catalytic domain superfamily [Septoria linicola]|nr:putative peptidase M54, archaemetzincin, metallopeptidase, catalytic domain superfamily [Septoria linicola]
MSGCKHEALLLEPSTHAQEAGYKRPSQHERMIAAQSSSNTRSGRDQTTTFPAPLILPGDELSFDPKTKGQSMRSWQSIRNRVAHTGKRRTIYVVPPPGYASGAEHVRDWTMPQKINAGKKGVARSQSGSQALSPPATEDVREYLEAFYHPLRVKPYEGSPLEFMPWNESEAPNRNTPARDRIGLNIGTEAIGIRYRPCIDDLYSKQLNLNDLLDAAIAILPKDAYAILMLVDHDLYEYEADDFCCGRAYGGSRVALVCSSRYNPAVDKLQEVETEHVWPLSHCQAFVDAVCKGEALERPPPKRAKSKTSARTSDPTSAMLAAVDAYIHTLKTGKRTREAQEGLWFSRLCKTASHEVGHCVGMGHCVYYACVMQGTAGLSEDGAQPPYLCPVDLAKTLAATGAEAKERYEALLRFCEKWSVRPGGEMWAAYGAWLRVLLEKHSVRSGSNVDNAIELSP